MENIDYSKYTCNADCPDYKYGNCCHPYNCQLKLVKKPIKAKPHFYACALQGMQKIALDMGYNLVIHGSMNRDMDLVAIPWIDEPKTHLELLNAFSEFLGTKSSETPEQYNFSVLAGGRSSYVINLNRGDAKFSPWQENENQDAEYYIDISITPLK